MTSQIDKNDLHLCNILIGYDSVAGLFIFFVSCDTEIK